VAYPFVKAKHYRKGRGGLPILWIVLHTVEAPERDGTAEAIAEYFRTTTRPASAHWCVDRNSIIQCVREADQAAAAPGSNQQGLHVELAGYAKQTAEDWSDAYSDEMLRRAAKLCAAKAEEYDIPVRWRLPAELKAGEPGFTSHANVSKAFRRSTHWDPGPGFPVGRFMRLVREAGKK
jgi:N-acetyl-anhydromuramyl-L-alanine amidase AmpD